MSDTTLPGPEYTVPDDSSWKPFAEAALLEHIEQEQDPLALAVQDLVLERAQERAYLFVSARAHQISDQAEAHINTLREHRLMIRLAKVAEMFADSDRDPFCIAVDFRGLVERTHTDPKRSSPWPKADTVEFLGKARRIIREKMSGGNSQK